MSTNSATGSNPTAAQRETQKLRRKEISKKYNIIIKKKIIDWVKYIFTAVEINDTDV